MVRNNFIFCFSIQFRNVPDVTPSSSAMDWFVPCSVNDTRNIFLYYSFFFQMHFMFLFRVHVLHPCVAVGNMHVRIIRNFILLFVAFNSFSMSINFVHAIACLWYTRNNTNWSLCQITQNNVLPIMSFFYEFGILFDRDSAAPNPKF